MFGKGRKIQAAKKKKAEKIKTEEEAQFPMLVFYNPHSIPLTQRDWSKDPYLQICTFDPAKKNLGIRVERRYENKVETVILERVDLTRYSEIFVALTEVLNMNFELFSKSHIVGIEIQLYFNPIVARVQQHILTYFLMRMKDLPHLPLIMDVNSKLKGNILGAPKGCDLKKWAPEKAIELFQQRGDQMGMKLLTSERKQDDRADVTLMAEAIVKYLGIGQTPIS